MIFALITGWLAYKRAVASGRNGVLWAVIGIGFYIGAQLLVGLGIGIFLGFGVALLNWPESVFDDYTLPINIVAIISAFFASWLLLKFLDKMPPEEGIVDAVASSSAVTNPSGGFQDQTETLEGEEANLIRNHDSTKL